MRHIPVILFYLLLVSCKKEEPADYDARTSYFGNIVDSTYHDSVFRCVTYNIQLGFNAGQDPWNKNTTGADEAQIRAIAALLKKADPDIIALQEVPRNRFNAVIGNFLEVLAGEMNMNYAFGAHGFNDPYDVWPVQGEWGVAVLTKYRIIAIQNQEVEYISKWERRSILDVQVETRPQQVMHVISLHHLPSDEGIPNTARYLEKLSGPIICMGDFNYTGEIQAFAGIGLRDSDSTDQHHEIDRIFYSSSYFTCTGSGTLDDSVGISDHLAIYSILKASK